MEKDDLIIDKKDLENIKSISDYIIVKEDEVDLYLSAMGDELKSINKGYLSILINEHYLIIYETFKKVYKGIVRSILQNKAKHIDKNMLYVLNYILIFSPEFYTIYSLKKRMLMSSKDQLLLFNEFNFINCINLKNRKCSISWDYRLFIIKRLENVNIDKIEEFRNKYNTLIGLLGVVDFNNKLCYDLLLLDNINAGEKRNYHLWKYLVHLMRFYDNLQEKLCLLIFAVNALINDSMDHSAFSFLVTFGDYLQSRSLFEYLEIVIEKFGIKNSYLNEFKDKIRC
jgi:hypothetical protein